MRLVQRLLTTQCVRFIVSFFDFQFLKFCRGINDEYSVETREVNLPKMALEIIT